MSTCPRCGAANRPGARYCLSCGAALDALGSGSRVSPARPRPRLPTVAAPRRQSPGDRLQDRYRIERVLGEGGFGAVYLAYDERISRLCVVKQMLPPKKNDYKDTQAWKREVDSLGVSFDREARALAALNTPGHPNIPEIFDYFQERSGNYLVMKYIEGENLEQRMRRTGAPIPWQEAVEIAIPVAGALDYMHNFKDPLSRELSPVLHRDIQPANILVDSQERVWLVDFGLTKAEAQPLLIAQAGKTSAAGTPGYAPLEQWNKKSVPTSDVYALGATLHHVLTGQDPQQYFTSFDLEAARSQHGNFGLVRQFTPEIPLELEAVVMRALRKDPAQRPTAAAFKAELEAILRPPAGGPVFTWQDRTISRSPKDLADEADRRRAEAQAYLQDGSWERWLNQINRNDLVKQVREIKTANPGRPAVALEQVQRLLDPQLPRPTWTVEPLQVDLGVINLNEAREPQARLTVRHSGKRGLLFGTIQPGDAWLAASPAQFELAPGGEAVITLSARRTGLAWESRYAGSVKVESNAGKRSLPVQLATPPQWADRELWLELAGQRGGLMGDVWGAGLGSYLSFAIHSLLLESSQTPAALAAWTADHSLLVFGLSLLAGALAGIAASRALGGKGLSLADLHPRRGRRRWFWGLCAAAGLLAAWLMAAFYTRSVFPEAGAGTYWMAALPGGVIGILAGWAWGAAYLAGRGILWTAGWGLGAIMDQRW